MKKIILLIILMFSSEFAKSQGTYFPPKNNNDWDTLAPGQLGWDVTKIPELYSFLGQSKTKAFILLKDGKIVLEKYFGTFVQDSLWYWASAGKTITSYLIGKAQEDGFLKIDDKTSKYLGKGWTSLTEEKEDLITIRNQLTMTTGFDDKGPDNHCTLPSCLVYKADAGTRWAYHNAPYTLLDSILEVATGKNINVLTQSSLKSKIGMGGFWYKIDYDNVYFSTARDMARFGIFISNNCNWDGSLIFSDENYKSNMVNTSQNINLSYGYLWWLNGKESFMIPQTQFKFNGPLCPNAPADMYAAVGKNGQILSIARKEGLIFVRMGEDPSEQSEISITLCNEIWNKINKITQGGNLVKEKGFELKVYPNPFEDKINIQNTEKYVIIYNIFGQKVKEIHEDIPEIIDLSYLLPGIYYLKDNKSLIKLVKL